jgi:disulfide oxidoreductase YuzD
MESNKIQVALYTVPQVACSPGKIVWKDVAVMVRSLLNTAFPGKITFKHIEFMSEAWFDDTHSRAQSLLETGQVNFPFVLVNGEVVCADKKVNISKIRRFIQSKL